VYWIQAELEYDVCIAVVYNNLNTVTILVHLLNVGQMGSG